MLVAAFSSGKSPSIGLSGQKHPCARRRRVAQQVTRKILVSPDHPRDRISGPGPSDTNCGSEYDATIAGRSDSDIEDGSVLLSGARSATAARPRCRGAPATNHGVPDAVKQRVAPVSEVTSMAAAPVDCRYGP
jgi:hypothetical protein